MALEMGRERRTLCTGEVGGAGLHRVVVFNVQDLDGRIVERGPWRRGRSHVRVGMLKVVNHCMPLTSLNGCALQLGHLSRCLHPRSIVAHPHPHRGHLCDPVVTMWLRPLRLVRL
jgi:hypothetical protein